LHIKAQYKRRTENTVFSYVVGPKRFEGVVVVVVEKNIFDSGCGLRA